MRAVGVFAIVFLVSALLFSATQQAQKVDVPVLPTERDQFGGRPGTFHFTTNEQIMAEANENQKALAAVEAIEKMMASQPEPIRERMAPQLTTLRSFVIAVDVRHKTPAGKTAGEIEQRLNAAKGKFMCGACHGHGMGMMHGMGPMGGRND